MELYTTPALSGQRETCLTGRGTDVGLVSPVAEPMRAELLAAIQGSRMALGLNQWQSRSISSGRTSRRVYITEGSISELQTKVDTLQRQMTEVTSKAGTIEDRVEDVEGRSRCNNIRLIGFPEWAEGPLWSIGCERRKDDGTTQGALRSTWRSREAARQLEFSPGEGASQTRVKIQEDGMMALTQQDVTIESMEMADVDGAVVVDTGT
ncbi:hypothetical protein NDU88_007985 [Pleurodeles waltl]|uniref:Uncharacterized protein n=1 Tax=Pleurodeles waltl TaxID=8319 RepID=A0AAV7QM74_PLEWA|nr:hypothetical protein NDU88_007985 [Pleurodeles waltl]